MKIANFLIEEYKEPCLLFVSSKVKGVNKALLEMTLFEESDFKGKSINETLKLLRACLPQKVESLNKLEACEAIIFTKNSDPLQVSVSVSEAAREAYTCWFARIKPDDFDNLFKPIHSLLSDNQVGVAIFKAPELVLLKSNQAYLDFLPVPYNSKIAAAGNKISKLLPNWKDSMVEKRIKQVFEGSTVYLNDIPCNNTECTKYYNHTITPVNCKGSFRYALYIITDVTEKFLYKARLEEQNRLVRKQKDQLQAIIESIYDTLYIMDREGRYIEVKNNTKSWEAPEHIKKVGDSLSTISYFNSSDQALCLDSLPSTRVLRGERVSHEKMYSVLDGDEFHYYINGTPVFDETGKVELGVLCMSDITNEVKYQKTLKKQRDYFMQVFNTLELPIVSLSYPDLLINELNRKACSMLKRVKWTNIDPDVDKVRGTAFRDLLQVLNMDPEAFDRRIKELADKKGIVVEGNTTIVYPGGTSYYKLAYHPFLDQKGNITEILILAIDITPEVEKSVNFEKALQMKDDFVSFISHEFRTPLNIINSAVQALEYICGNELSAKARGFLGNIRQNTYRQLRLVNNLLDSTKLNAGLVSINPVYLDIVAYTAAISESVRVFAAQKAIILTFETGITELWIAFDEEKLERVLLNLLSNAIKFTPEGGAITVGITVTGSNVAIEIKDQGPGIPEEKQELIFQRFGQAGGELKAAEGTGLGLYLVKSLIEAMGGNISLKSRPGSGSSFTITLPFTDQCDTPEKGKTTGKPALPFIRTIDIEFSDIYR